MILEFSIENFRSFRERQTFSLIPDDGRRGEADHFIEVGDKYKLLRSAVIYGANASGKSNFVKAFQALRNLVLDPNIRWSGRIPGLIIKHEPFSFSARTQNAPTVFSLDFLLESIRYTYKVSVSAAIIVAESLSFYPQGREAKLFTRKGQTFEFGDYLKGQRNVVADLTNSDQLYLSKGADNNIAQLIEVYRYFKESILVILYDDLDHEAKYYIDIAERLFKAAKGDPFLPKFTALLKSFDTGILDFQIKESKHFKGNYNPAREFDIRMEHAQFDHSDQQAGSSFMPFESESKGTQKLFVLGGLLLQTLMQGAVIVIDEFERSLHPLISSYLINLFQDPKINNKGAQLIIATHDTNLLSNNEFRRDQIWIVEKDRTGASELYSLADITGILKGAPYEKWYLAGRMGGVPSIRSLDFELNYEVDEAK